MNSEKNSKKKNKHGSFLYDFVKITGALPTLLWLRPKVVYMSKKSKNVKGSVLIAANHNSFIDPVLLLCTFWRRRLSCLATKELYKKPILDFFFTHMHCIPVDRDNFSMNSFHAVTENLNCGKAVVIFPEGQVNNDEKSVMTFKSGAILMAYKSGAPILPIYLKKAHRWYERRKIIIGELIDIKELVGARPSVSELNRASEYLREREIELKSYCEEHFPDDKRKKMSKKEIIHK